MTTRFNSNPGEPDRLDSGYVGTSTGSSYTIQACGIEDIDRAVLRMFDEEIPFVITKKNHGTPTDVKVVFSTSERWKLSKRSQALRDANGVLVLPLISIVRTSFVQDPTKDVAGRGMNQHTGKLVIKRRLSAEDRADEQLKNRLGISNQDNLAVDLTSAVAGQLATSRVTGELLLDPDVADGALLKPSLQRSGFEFISVPTPQFITLNYEITIWAQYVTEVNQLYEILFSSFLPTGHQCLKLVTPQGYWFVGKMSSGDLTSESNFDELSDAERLIKYKFVFEVPAYIFVSSAPGVPIAVHRYVANPNVSIEFVGDSTSSGLEQVNPQTSSGDLALDPFLGADDPTLPSEVQRIGSRDDERYTGDSPVFGRGGTKDPAVDGVRRGSVGPVFRLVKIVGRDGRTRIKHVRVKSSNSVTGETVYGSEFDLGAVSFEIIKLL